jgi:hypothetical protein
MTTLDTAAAVLAKASLYDQSFARPDAGIAVAWSSLIGELDRADALQAVEDHYGAQTRRLMPADILAGVKRIRAARLERDPEPAPDADPDDVYAYKAALLAGRNRVADGTERQRDVAQLLKPIAESKSVPTR